MNTIVPLFIGESEFISFDFTHRLESGQTIVSAVYTCESPITEDDGSAAVNATGTIAQARFTVPPTALDGIQYTVKCTATCATPTATKILFATIKARLIST